MALKRDWNAIEANTLLSIYEATCIMIIFQARKYASLLNRNIFHFGFRTGKEKCNDLIQTELVFKTVAINGFVKAYPKFKTTVS